MPDKSELLSKLQAEGIGDCKRCDLCRERQNIVFGVGSPDADIMFVGEGPGANEDKKGEPFVGKAGYVLDKLLEKIGVQRENVYIANVVKCRPPGNRDPKPEEIKECRGFLEEQIRIIQPRVLVGLGRFAGNWISGQRALSMGALREDHSWQYRRDGIQIWAVPTYHPAWLLYQKGNSQAFEDVLADLRRALSLVQEDFPPDPETEDVASLFDA